MAKVIVMPPRDEIAIRDRWGVLLGWCIVDDGIIRARSLDGRTKSTQVGGSPPETLAWMMLRELQQS